MSLIWPFTTIDQFSSIKTNFVLGGDEFREEDQEEEFFKDEDDEEEIQKQLGRKRQLRKVMKRERAAEEKQSLREKIESYYSGNFYTKPSSYFAFQMLK